MKPQMVIDGVAYVEAPETDGCAGCAFLDENQKCSAAIRIARETFGGRCSLRNVIYIRSDSAPRHTAMAELLKARDAINAAIAALEAA